MFGYIVTHKEEKRVVISTRDNILFVLYQFLHDVYNANDDEVRINFEFSYKNKTWSWGNMEGTFEPISVITT